MDEPEHDPMTRREKVERQIALAEARCRELLSGIAEADAALRAANLATFRDEMRALFRRRPELTSLRFDQGVAYNDEFYEFELRDLWVNGLYFDAYESILNSYGAARELLQSFTDDWDPGYATPDPAPLYDPRSDSDAYDGLSEEEALDLVQASYDAVAAAAQDAADTLRDLRVRYGRHFYWDTFGPYAAVEVTPGELRVTDDVPPPPSGSVMDVECLDDEWTGQHLGAYARAYLTSPERSGPLALRLAYRAELQTITDALDGARRQAGLDPTPPS